MKRKIAVLMALLMVVALGAAVAQSKTRRYSDVESFQFLEMSDGCYVGVNSRHYEYRYVPGLGSAGTPGTGYLSGTRARTNQIHRNDNGTINSWIREFNDDVRYYNATRSNNDNARFNSSNVGDRYYIYSITSDRVTLGGEAATRYTYRLRRVDVVR